MTSGLSPACRWGGGGVPFRNGPEFKMPSFAEDIDRNRGKFDSPPTTELGFGEC
jgi:hypothetical protein